MNSWQELRLELELEAEAVFATTGQVFIVMPDTESDSVMRVLWGTKSLQLMYCPERNAVRWDAPREYGFERIPQEIALLARSLIQRLRDTRSANADRSAL